MLIDDATGWVAGFQGLFGLDTEDRLAGERAPAGPKWARDGRPRQSWIDPVALAGLDATPPPARAQEALAQEVDGLRSQLQMKREAVTDLEGRAQRLGLRVNAAQRAGRSDAYGQLLAKERDETVEELRAARSLDRLESSIRDGQDELARLSTGDLGDPRSHLRLVVHPQDPSEIQRSRILDLWSALSVAAAIIVFALLLFTSAAPWWVGIVIIMGGYIAIEALVRRRFLSLLLTGTVILAIVAFLILLISYITAFVAIALLAIGVIILRDNLREVRQASR